MLSLNPFNDKFGEYSEEQIKDAGSQVKAKFNKKFGDLAAPQPSTSVAVMDDITAATVKENDDGIKN